MANHGRLGQSEGSAQPAECRWTAQGSGVESGPYGILRWASAGWVASAQGSGAAAPAPVYSSTDLVAVSLGPCQHAGEPKAAACVECIAALEGACAAAAGVVLFGPAIGAGASLPGCGQWVLCEAAGAEAMRGFRGKGVQMRLEEGGSVHMRVVSTQDLVSMLVGDGTPG